MGFPFFRAKTERVVVRIGRNLGRGVNLHILGLLSDQVDDFSDEVGTNAEAS